MNRGEIMTKLIDLHLLLQSIIETSNNNITITDQYGVVLFTNEEHWHLYGIDNMSAIVGKTVYELEEQQILKPSVISFVIQTQRKAQVMQETKTNRFLMTTAYPIFNEDGTLLYVICYTQDQMNILNLHENYDKLQRKLESVQAEMSSLQSKAQITYRSKSFDNVLAILNRVAHTDAAVLMLGESGVGKSMLARYLHDQSNRAKGPFIEVNCSTIPETLFESEMFGYESGSFTGASKNGKMGLIQQAHQGTLFLDEIGEMPLTMQVKMLKVLQEKKFKAIGSQKESNVDFRLVTATNRDLRKMVDEGKFRLDLYYRLNVISVEIPPLRKRPEDITALIHYYLDEMNKKYDTLKKLHPLTFQAFLDYEWPGNTRELANALERLVLTTDSLVIMPNQLPIEIMQELPSSLHLEECESLNLNEAIQAIERKLFEKAQEKATTTYEMAALLGVSQPTVVRKLKKLEREKRE